MIHCACVTKETIFHLLDFLGRTEIQIRDIFEASRTVKGPIIKRLPLYEVSSGEVIIKIDLQLFEN